MGQNLTRRIDYFVLCPTGPVTASANLASNNGVDCSIAGSNCAWNDAGGLVGQNSGTIQGAAPVVGFTVCGPA